MTITSGSPFPDATGACPGADADADADEPPAPPLAAAAGGLGLVRRGGGTVAGTGIGSTLATSCLRVARALTGKRVLQNVSGHVHVHVVVGKWVVRTRTSCTGAWLHRKLLGQRGRPLALPTAQAHAAHKADVDDIMVAETHGAEVDRILWREGEGVEAERRWWEVDGLGSAKVKQVQAYVEILQEATTTIPPPVDSLCEVGGLLEEDGRCRLGALGWEGENVDGDFLSVRTKLLATRWPCPGQFPVPVKLHCTGNSTLEDSTHRLLCGEHTVHEAHIAPLAATSTRRLGRLAAVCSRVLGSSRRGIQNKNTRLERLGVGRLCAIGVGSERGRRRLGWSPAVDV